MPDLPSTMTDFQNQSFMEEGPDKDDRYRMVEDEFLSVAQQFTVHLHAAEYKRRQKAAKSRNADTINSISRPVVGRKPDHTNRKVEAVALAKRQRALIEGLNGKKGGGISDDSDADDLPYIGTSLHGLMDSPRKKAASLAKLKNTATTRAAAGFKRPTHADGDLASILESPSGKKALQASVGAQDGMESTDDDNDDDLDAPIPARKLDAPNRKPTSISNRIPTSFPSKPSEPVVKEESKSFTSLRGDSSTRSFIKEESPPVSTRISRPMNDNLDELFSRPSRAERARRAKIKKEEEEEEKEPRIKKEYDYIPTF